MERPEQEVWLSGQQNAAESAETQEAAACVAPPGEELRWILIGEDDQLGGQLMLS